MKTHFNLTVSGIFLAILLTSCSSEVYQAGYQVKPVKTDGMPSEWSVPLRFSDVASGLQYSITNDAGNLYICLRATETSTRMRMLMSGVELWIDPSGKHKRTTLIKFPVNDREQRPMHLDGERASQERKLAEMQKIMLENPHFMQLSGFNPSVDGKIPASEPGDVQAAINQDSLGFITIEYTIPFRTFYQGSISSLKKDPVFGFEIVLPAARIPVAAGERPPNREQSGGSENGEGESRRGGGEGRMMNGGMGGKGGGHGRGNEMGEHRAPPGGQGMQSKQEDSVVKFKIKLNRGTGK